MLTYPILVTYEPKITMREKYTNNFYQAVHKMGKNKREYCKANTKKEK